MDNQHIHSAKHLKDTRSHLRNNMTVAEAILWTGLKNSKLANRKFRRQHSILNYIVDFYCPEEKLIVELDGNHHFKPGGPEADSERDAVLTSLGYKVLRFENNLVINYADAVLEKIAECFNNL